MLLSPYIHVKTTLLLSSVDLSLQQAHILHDNPHCNLTVNVRV